MTGTVVIGVGSEFRRDDGAGLAVLGLLRPDLPATVRLVPSDGEPLRLIEDWAGADLAVVIDALPPGGGAGPAGQVRRLVVAEIGAAPAGTSSSHGLGLAEAVGIGQALGRLPGRLVVYAVQAADTGYGPGLTPAVDAAVRLVAEAVIAELPA